MFFNYGHLEPLGYKILGIGFSSKNTCNHYIKYFPEHNAIVVFSTIFENRLLVYRLTEEQYNGFIKGEYALSHTGKGYGNTPCGVPVKNYGVNVLFSGGNITRYKKLKEMLSIAEDFAQGKEVKYEIVTELKRK